MIKSLRPDEIGALALEDLNPSVPEGMTSVALNLKKRLADPLALTYRLYDPSDAEVLSGELALEAGATSVTLSGLPLPADNALDEPDRVYRIVIADSLGKTSRVRLTVLDDDDPPTASISDDAVTEGGSLSFTVSLSGPSGRGIGLTYGTVSGGTAMSGADFTALAPTTVTIPAGDTSFTFSVSTLDDSLHESSETVHVRLSSPVHVTLSDDTGVGTINDNDASPALSVSDASGLEGAGLVFTVSLSAASGRETTFEWGTSDGTATGGLDFTAVSGASATIAAGGTSTTLTVSSLSDGLTEGDEAFSVVLTNPVNATVADDTGVGTIQDNLPPPAPGQFDDGAFYYSSSETPVLRWAASTGQTHYEVAIGTSSGGTNVLSWTNIGDVTSYQATGLTLTPGTMYYASVRAVGGGGATPVSGDGWLALGQQKLARTGPAWDGRENSMRFGSNQALSEDGQVLVVGVPSASLDEDGLSGSIFGTGAAYVFVREGSSWRLHQRLVATGTNARVNDDRFGTSVAISGETIVVGAVGQDFDADGANSVSAAGAAYVFTRSGGVWSQQQKLVATGTNARVASDQFGQSVAISGETVVVGAAGQDFDADGANLVAGAGAAYVFARSGGVWSQQQKLAATGTNARVASDQFGQSVAISGETVVVGAHNQDFDADGANSANNAGAAYVFTRSGGAWSQQQKLVATGTNAREMSDRFGASVAISGETIVVGARQQFYDETGGNAVPYAGAAYVFTRSGGVWSQQQKLVATGTNARVVNDYFGASVAISGETIVVGAIGQTYDANGANFLSGAGAAYVFTRSGGVWSQQQKLVATGTNARMANDQFGHSVSISGEVIVVGAYGQEYDASGANLVSGAGAAYAFTRSGGIWGQDQKLTASRLVHERVAGQFGSSLSLSEDGSTLVVGAAGDRLDEAGIDGGTGSGSAHVYVKQSGRWVLQQKLTAIGTNARQGSDDFGASVSISGETIVVGAPQQYWDANGVNLQSNAGAAYVFTRSGGVWSQQQKLVATGTNARMMGDHFGASVAISGETIVIGASMQSYDAAGANSVNGAGAAYVFTRSGGVWNQQQKLVATGTNARMASDYFGVSVAISGETIAVGATTQDYDAGGANSENNAGAAYVFTRSGGVWSQQQKLVATGTNARVASDYFGSSVAVFGETLAVGARQQGYDANGLNFQVGAGAVYMFTRSGGVWGQQQKLVATGANARMANDLFGSSVVISGDAVVVGATGQDFDAAGASFVSDAGAAYVFTRVGGVWSQQQKLVATGTNARMEEDRLGSAVSISGETVVVGTPAQNYDASGANPVSQAGAVHVFYAGSVPESPQLSLAPASGVEGGLLTFRVTMNKPWPRDVTFKADTFGGSATPGVDYTALTNATYTIPAGQTGVDVDVSTVNDGLNEDDESFRLMIHSADEASPVGPSAWGTIQDDD